MAAVQGARSDLFGYRYWPIFERLEAELETLSNREDRLHARLSGPSRRSSATGMGSDPA